MEERIKALEEKVDILEFKIKLLAENSTVSRLLFEYDVTEEQYNKVMKLMDRYRDDIDESKDVNHSSFESQIYEIVPQRKYDYHFCEYLAQSFMEDGRWEEVFPALYGDMPKYKYYMENRGKEGL